MNRPGGRTNRRTGGVPEENTPKHRATMDIKKFGLPTNPLEMEAKMKVMEPLPTEFWHALENQIKHMQNTADDEFERKVADRLIANYADDRYETLKNEIRLDFANSFRCWLATYHKFEQGKIEVAWDNENDRWRVVYQPGDELIERDENIFHAMPKVISDYFRKHIEAAGDYQKKIVHLKDRDLKSLTDYYLYFKYIVGGNTPGTSIPAEGVGYNELPDGFLQQYLTTPAEDDWHLPGFNVPACEAEEITRRRHSVMPAHRTEIVGSDSDSDDDDATIPTSPDGGGGGGGGGGGDDNDDNDGGGGGGGDADTTVHPPPDGTEEDGDNTNKPSSASVSPSTPRKTVDKGEGEEDDVKPGTQDIQHPEEDDGMPEIPINENDDPQTKQEKGMF